MCGHPPVPLDLDLGVCAEAGQVLVALPVEQPDDLAVDKQVRALVVVGVNGSEAAPELDATWGGGGGEKDRTCQS